MNRPLSDFFTSDHRRLEQLLEDATRIPGSIDPVAYGKFRCGLLRHISLEEKILLPAAQRLNGGRPIRLAAKMRLDHGAIAALLVPTPTGQVFAALRDILAKHDVLEEEPGGAYDIIERLTAAEVEELLRRVRGAPEVSVVPNRDEPFVLEATRRALARAGYNFDAYA